MHTSVNVISLVILVCGITVFDLSVMHTLHFKFNPLVGNITDPDQLTKPADQDLHCFS